LEPVLEWALMRIKTEATYRNKGRGGFGS